MVKKKGSKKKDGLKRSEKIELAAAIHELMVEGNTDGDIIDELGVTAQDFAAGKKFLLETIGTEQELMSSKERFAYYLIQAHRNTADLDDLVTNLNSKTQYNVILGAIRMRADIQDRVITTGQTLGVIDKEPEKKQIVAGIAIGELPDKELRKGVVNAIAGLSGLFERYGDAKKLTELTPGTLHYGEAVEVKKNDGEDGTAALGAPPIKEQDKKGKRNRAKSNKRSAGRRRVKEKGK